MYFSLQVHGHAEVYCRALGFQYGGRVLSEGVTFDDEANQDDDLDGEEEIERIETEDSPP